MGSNTIIQTYCGLAFDLANPTQAMIDIRDISNALANLARFTGHTRSFYSVAQHCVLASRFAHLTMGGPVKTQQEAATLLIRQRSALLHDAHEAYLGDLSSPLKNCKGVRESIDSVAHSIDQCIAAAFGVPVFAQNDRWKRLAEVHEPIKTIDQRLLETERVQLFPSRADALWSKFAEVIDIEIVPLQPDDARAAFTDRFMELWGMAPATTGSGSCGRQRSDPVIVAGNTNYELGAPDQALAALIEVES